MTELALVLLPGLDGNGVLFRPIMTHFPPRIRPIVVSFPSDRLLGYEELLPVVLAALPHEFPFVLVGESFSGPLALMAAATRPPNLLGVVLCASFVRSPLRFRFRWMRYLVRPALFRLYPRFVLVRGILSRQSTSELRALAAEALVSLSPKVLAHRVRAVMGVDVSSELGSCAVPILYIRAKYDVVVPRRNLIEIQAACPSIQVECLDGPHAILQTQPTAAAAVIMAFVRNLLVSDNPALIAPQT
jgi:pimeloyl-ACP methyl ester carboxylesterase